jgi:hypothetical protein
MASATKPHADDPAGPTIWESTARLRTLLPLPSWACRHAGVAPQASQPGCTPQ